MATQQLIHPPLNTSITVLDTASKPTERFAFTLELLPPQYAESAIEFQLQSSLNIMATPAVKKTMTMVKNNFHYLIPAIILNPILFLHAINAMLTAILPDLNIPYSTNTWFQPHLNINHNNTVAAIYTVLIVVLQGFACQYCLDITACQEARKESDGGTTDDDYWQD